MGMYLIEYIWDDGNSRRYCKEFFTHRQVAKGLLKLYETVKEYHNVKLFELRKLKRLSHANPGINPGDAGHDG